MLGDGTRCSCTHEEEVGVRCHTIVILRSMRGTELCRDNDADERPSCHERSAESAITNVHTQVGVRRARPGRRCAVVAHFWLWEVAVKSVEGNESTN